jgi:DNA-binding transcriptional LysR family regulator
MHPLHVVTRLPSSAFAVASLVAHAVYPSRRHLQHKLRAFLDFLQALYGPTPYWDEGLTL